MGNTVRIRNGMENATEGDILGSASDIIKDLGVVDLAGGHLLVTQNSPLGMSVQVAGGVVYVPNSNYSILDSDTPKFYPVVCSNEVLAVDNNVSGSTRYDIVCVKIDKVIVPDPDASNVATKVVIKGTPGAGVPATPANHYKLAEIKVVNGETEITNAEITDKRTQVHLNTILIPGLPSGAIVGTTDTQELSSKTLTSPILKGSIGGWISIPVTCSYAGADDPTYTMYVSGNATTYLWAGMRFKCTQTTDRMFIITAVGTYDSGNNRTPITLYGGTDFDLANATITNPYYSPVKCPYGFPMNPDKWSVIKTHTTQNYSMTTPSNWQNIGVNIALSIPIGFWDVYYNALIYAEKASGDIEVYSTLSTTTNSETNTDFTCASIGMTSISGSWHTKSASLNLSSKTTYNLIGKSSGTSIGILGNFAKCIIRATCAYL